MFKNVSRILLMFLLVLIAGTGHAESAAKPLKINYELSLIDDVNGWVSAYWGYNAPKLVYDGKAFYTVGLWGDKEATAKGCIYQYRDHKWVKGFTFDLNYQPPMLLLDSQKRLILIYSQMNAKPKMLRSAAFGDFNHFAPLPVSDKIAAAGYIGAAIHNDKIILGYIGNPELYSFNMITCDLKTMKWSEPTVLAPSQRKVEPWTTWLYPVFWPEDGGVHVISSSNGYPGYTYSRLDYLYLNYDHPTTATLEMPIDLRPWRDRNTFAEAMWRDLDGTMYVTAQYTPEKMESNGLYFLRRNPQTKKWDKKMIGPNRIAAIFQNAREPGTLWLASAAGDRLFLQRSTNKGEDWLDVDLPDFSRYKLTNSYFLYGIHPSSGSVMPEEPCAVFVACAAPRYQSWFVRFRTGAVAKEQAQSKKTEKVQ